MVCPVFDGNIAEVGWGIGRLDLPDPDRAKGHKINQDRSLCLACTHWLFGDHALNQASFTSIRFQPKIQHESLMQCGTVDL